VERDKQVAGRSHTTVGLGRLDPGDESAQIFLKSDSETSLEREVTAETQIEHRTVCTSVFALETNSFNAFSFFKYIEDCNILRAKFRGFNKAN
jgi:hypothetical protein